MNRWTRQPAAPVKILDRYGHYAEQNQRREGRFQSPPRYSVWPIPPSFFFDHGYRSRRRIGRWQKIDNSNRPDEAVAFAHNGLHETRTLRIVTQGLAYFTNGGVDAVLSLNENARAPQLSDDLLAGHQFAFSADQ